jgi:hypothetical protein
VSYITLNVCCVTLRDMCSKRRLKGTMKRVAALPTAAWEYCEFELFGIPDQDRDRVFLGWVREGWELVGVHAKGKGQRKPLPVAIMRRELMPATVAI